MRNMAWVFLLSISMFACVGSKKPDNSQNNSTSSTSSSSSNSSSSTSSSGFSNSSGTITPTGVIPNMTSSNSSSGTSVAQPSIENLAKQCAKDEDCGTGLYCLTGEFSGGIQTQDGKEIPGFFHKGYCALLAADFCEQSHGCPDNTFCTYPPLMPKTLEQPYPTEQACDPAIGCGDPNLLQCAQNQQGQFQCFLMAIYLPFCIPQCDQSRDTCPEGTICEQWSETDYGCTPKCPGESEEQIDWCQNFLQSVSLSCNGSTGKCEETQVNIDKPCESHEDCPLGICYKESDFVEQKANAFPGGLCIYPCFNPNSDYCGEGYFCQVSTPDQPGKCTYLCDPNKDTESCNGRENLFCYEDFGIDQKTPSHFCFPDCNKFDLAKNQTCVTNELCCSEKKACMPMAECSQ